MNISCSSILILEQTKGEIEERRRKERMEREEAFEEAEMAAMDGEQQENDDELDSLQDASAKDQDQRSWTAAGLGLAWRTTRTAVGLAAGLVSGADPAQSVFQPAGDAHGERKRQ